MSQSVIEELTMISQNDHCADAVDHSVDEKNAHPLKRSYSTEILNSPFSQSLRLEFVEPDILGFCSIVCMVASPRQFFLNIVFPLSGEAHEHCRLQ